jgi:hypothetical protein
MVSSIWGTAAAHGFAPLDSVFRLLDSGDQAMIAEDGECLNRLIRSAV